MSTFRASVNLAGFVLLTLVCAPIQYCAQRLGLPSRLRIPLFYHRAVCRILGARIHIVGAPIDSGLILANHTSWLDIVLLSTVTPLSFVAKSEVGSWPLFGMLARLQNTMFVRRSEKSRTLSDREVIRKRLANGEVLVIFPEGTSSDGNRVLPFKSALVAAAEWPLGEGEPPLYPKVQPVTIAYVASYGIPMGRETRPFYAWYGDMDMAPHFWGVFGHGPLDAVIEFHPPMTVAEAGSRKELARRAEADVRAGLIRALHGEQLPNVALIAGRRDDADDVPDEHAEEAA